MTRVFMAVLLGIGLIGTSSSVWGYEDPLQRLKDGNARFVADRPIHPREDEARRARTAKSQDPFAVVLSCADSRVVPEMIFDQGIGDVFDVRVAGNVAGPDETASIEYVVAKLHTPLLVVMGHTSCGAVAAAVEKSGGLSVRIVQLIAPIAPAVEQARAANPDLKGAALVNAAVRANVMQQIRVLLWSSDVVRDAVRAGKLQVVGAVYDLPSGRVEFLGPHPEQDRLVAGSNEASGDGSAELMRARH